MKTYEFQVRLGIDDLEVEWAWTGSSQGDTSCTNRIEEVNEWLTYNFKHINCLDQDAIDAEVAKRRKANQEYVERLKAEGRYGQLGEPIKIHVIENALFDQPISKNQPLESHKIIFLNES